MQPTTQSSANSSIEPSLPRPAGLASWLPKFMVGPMYRPKVFQIFEPCPAYYRAAVHAWCLGMWGGPLGRDVKESIAVAVSAANQCPY